MKKRWFAGHVTEHSTRSNLHILMASPLLGTAGRAGAHIYTGLPLEVLCGWKVRVAYLITCRMRQTSWGFNYTHKLVGL